MQVPKSNRANNKSIQRRILAINMDLNFMGYGFGSGRPNPRRRFLPPRLRVQSTPHHSRCRRRGSPHLSSDRSLQNGQDFSSLHCFNRHCSLCRLHLSHAPPRPHAPWPHRTDRPQGQIFPQKNRIRSDFILVCRRRRCGCLRYLRLHLPHASTVGILSNAHSIAFALNSVEL